MKSLKVAKQIAKLFDLGAYIENSPDLFVAIAKQQKECCLETLEKMVLGLETIYDYEKSDLYQHIKFNEKAENVLMKDMIKKSLESDEELDFIREEVSYQRIMKLLD